MAPRQALLVVALAATAVAAKRPKLTPSEDCIVTSTKDGETVTRDCYVLNEDSPELKPATKGRFESCTQ